MDRKRQRDSRNVDRPSSPSYVRHEKQARREDLDEHPANKLQMDLSQLPPSLRGRVTLPHEPLRERVRPQQSPRSPDPRNHAAGREQQASRGRTFEQQSTISRPIDRQRDSGDRDARRGRSRSLDRNGDRSRVQPVMKEREQPRGSPREGDRQRAASRYDMVSPQYMRSKGAAANTGSRAPASNTRRDLEPCRARDSSSRDHPAAAGSRGPQHSSREHSSREREADRELHADRRPAHHQSNRPGSRPRNAAHATPERRSQGRQRDGDTGTDKDRPVDGSSRRLEKGQGSDAARDPTPAADAGQLQQQKEQQQQQQQHDQDEQPQEQEHQGGAAVADSPAAAIPAADTAGSDGGRTRRGGHQKIEFNLDKLPLPSVGSGDLQPRRSSKYSQSQQQQEVSLSEQQQQQQLQQQERSGEGGQQQQQQQQLQLPRRSIASTDGSDGGRGVAGQQAGQQQQMRAASRGRDSSRDRAESRGEHSRGDWQQGRQQQQLQQEPRDAREIIMEQRRAAASRERREREAREVQAASRERGQHSSERRAASRERGQPSSERRAASSERRAASRERGQHSSERRAASREGQEPSRQRQGPSRELRASSIERREVHTGQVAGRDRQNVQDNSRQRPDRDDGGSVEQAGDRSLQKGGEAASRRDYSPAPRRYSPAPRRYEQQQQQQQQTHSRPAASTDVEGRTHDMLRDRGPSRERGRSHDWAEQKAPVAAAAQVAPSSSRQAASHEAGAARSLPGSAAAPPPTYQQQHTPTALQQQQMQQHLQQQLVQTEMPIIPSMAVCAEATAKLAALKARQEGVVALQLQGVPVSKNMCFKEVWMRACQASKLAPEQLDGPLAALRRRSAAAADLAGRFAGQLLSPVDPSLPVMLAAGGEEAHVKHLQQVIDSMGVQAAAPYFVQLPDGGSMLLPAELKGVLW